MKFFIFLLLAALLSSNAYSAFMLETISGFSTSTDSKTTASISDLTNHFFIGASIGQKQSVYIGQNVTSFSHQLKTSATDKISTLELGPRVIYYFDDENVFYSSFAWNPYAKGSRSVSGVTEEISGFSMLGSLGAELKINKTFHIGASLNYHSISITKAIGTSNTATTVSDTFSTLTPMVNLSIRFK